MADKARVTMKLVERIMQNSICVGYTAVDLKNNKARISRENALNYAKDGKIYNVAYRVTEGKPIIYGINGFKVNELPEVNIDIKPTLRIDIVYYKGKSIVGYLITDTKTNAQKKLDLKTVVSLVQKKQIIGIDTIEKLKAVNCKKVQLLQAADTKDELLKYYREHKEELIKQLNSYIRILEVSGTGETGEKVKILASINNLETLINQGKMNHDTLAKGMEAMKISLAKMTNDKATIVKASMLNQLLSSLDESIRKFTKLKVKYRKAVESDIKQVKTEITELRDNLSFEEFIKKYQEIKKLLASLDTKFVKLYKLQADEEEKIKLRENYINNELSKVGDNELKPIKRRIIERPWYIRYKSLMNSDSCLQTCIAQDEDGRKLRLIDMDITEKFVGRQRVGFKLTYNGKVYEYNERLTNMSLIASFIKVADDIGLKNREISAKFKKEDNSVLTLTV